MNFDSFHYFINFEILQWVKISGRAESSLVGRCYVLIYMLVMPLFIMFSELGDIHIQKGNFMLI